MIAAVRAGVDAGVGVRRTRHGLRLVRESITRLWCAHAIADVENQSNLGCCSTI